QIHADDLPAVVGCLHWGLPFLVETDAWQLPASAREREAPLLHRIKVPRWCVERAAACLPGNGSSGRVHQALGQELATLYAGCMARWLLVKHRRPSGSWPVTVQADTPRSGGRGADGEARSWAELKDLAVEHGVDDPRVPGLD